MALFDTIMKKIFYNSCLKYRRIARRGQTLVYNMYDMDIKRLIFSNVFIYLYVCQTLSTFESLSRINKMNLLLNKSYRATVYINVWNRNHAPSRFRIPLLTIPNDSDSDSTYMKQKWFRFQRSLESHSQNSTFIHPRSEWIVWIISYHNNVGL